jgi:hypothetical protein
MNSESRLSAVTSLGRPLDPAWPTNRAILWLLPLLAILGAGLAWRDGLDSLGMGMAAFRAALLGFGAWAVARELAPDDQPAAFFAMAIALTTLINVPQPGFGLLFLALFLARVMNRSTGLTLKWTDAAGVLVFAGLVAWGHGSPAPLAVTALAFGWGAFLPGGPRWQLWPAGIALVAAMAAVPVLGPGVGSGAPLSRHGVMLPGLFAAAFLITILATRRLASVGDHDGELLSPGRVRAGMWIVLMLAGLNLAHGSPLAAKGVALWSVLGGVALGRLLQVFRKR